MKDWNEDLMDENTVWNTKEVIRDNQGRRLTKEQMEEGIEYTYYEEEF